MAIAECEECGKSVSTHAKSCPHCGCPQEIMLSTYSETKEFFYENGEVKSRGNFNIQGQPEGKWTYFRKNGKVWQELVYKDGEQHGEQKHWNQDGKKASVDNYKDGKKNGRQLSWYENGQVRFLSEYQNGKLIRDESWYDNGQKETEKNWVDENVCGVVTWWYRNGQKEEEKHYQDGKLLTAERWSRNGHQSQETNVVNGNGEIVRNYSISCSETGVSLRNGPFEREIYKNGSLVEEKPAGACPSCEHPYYYPRPSECPMCCHDYSYEEYEKERHSRNINILWWIIGVALIILWFLDL